jgi:hypothetical protein
MKQINTSYLKQKQSIVKNITMGWRSAFVIVPTDDDLKRALEVVKAHNTHTGPDAGEELWC